MKKISQVLSEYQRSHQLTYTEMAKKLNLSKSSLYAYIKETRNPTIPSLLKIASSLNVNISSLFDVSFLDEQELKLLNHLRKEPNVHQLLLAYPKEQIEKIKQCLSQNNNTK